MSNNQLTDTTQPEEAIMTDTTFDFKKFIDDAIAASPVEAKLTRKVYRALRAAGQPVVAVWDSEERVPVKNEREMLEQVFNLDVAWLITENGDWVMLVRGNEWDLISDYTVAVEPDLQSVFDYIEKNGQ
ncbi:hypothetical protein PBI_KNOX_60 [Microbacterium phage Knox]|uniref:Uncharacterized protein n=13 Tax=Ilzatvirus TaxID=2560150 RepID=A0A516KQS7_9CAUD|nr:hypothetical protein H3N90_gp60 [Microbacterium phage Teagan]AUX82709.1 hypothetical protein PBI_AXIPUP_60 [Microbacterium phage AxiPup]AUX82771.1 hypothetical protein PBI_BAINES_59 [Microbacterium phage Baines]AUX83021.1 hypothetical protein PBI_KNOX_60 [Microbacterium phage Knox]QBZ73168.1 hypothetical protein SEA_TINSULPHUR_61 [Microbacterium phage TinSulphur]QCG78262.1 hypothetical protein SEA_GREYS_60 [Microbacterium phage Greys]QDM56984.1 hypothetical protein SEA_BONESMCCOY_60 [Micro